MEIGPILEAYGLAGVVIFALGTAVVALWRRVGKTQDDRLNDMREHSRELRAVSDNATAAINGLTRVLEDRRNG